MFEASSDIFNYCRDSLCEGGVKGVATESALTGRWDGCNVPSVDVLQYVDHLDALNERWIDARVLQTLLVLAPCNQLLRRVVDA